MLRLDAVYNVSSCTQDALGSLRYFGLETLCGEKPQRHQALPPTAFKRVHEHVVQWYRSPWAALYRKVPTTADATARTCPPQQKPARYRRDSQQHLGTSVDGGPRSHDRSVIKVRSEHGYAVNETQKPVGIILPLA